MKEALGHSCPGLCRSRRAGPRAHRYPSSRMLLALLFFKLTPPHATKPALFALSTIHPRPPAHLCPLLPHRLHLAYKQRCFPPPSRTASASALPRLVWLQGSAPLRAWRPRRVYITAHPNASFPPPASCPPPNPHPTALHHTAYHFVAAAPVPQLFSLLANPRRRPLPSDPGHAAPSPTIPLFLTSGSWLLSQHDTTPTRIPHGFTPVRPPGRLPFPFVTSAAAGEPLACHKASKLPPFGPFRLAGWP